MTKDEIREKIADLIEDILDFLDWDHAYDVADHLIANGVTVQEWIPVGERLPEKDQYIWCYSNKHGSYFFVGYRGWYTGEWMEGGCLHIGEVTHWMPLPEPPKEVE